MTRERIEELAAELHEVYMKEATRQGDVRHAEDYNDLPNKIKEFDRALARFIISSERLLLEKIGKVLTKHFDENGIFITHREKVDKALAIIEKEKGNV